MATYSNFTAWRISWTGEPGRLQSLESHRVGHSSSDLACVHPPDTSVGKESTCNARDPSSILGSGRSPGGGHGNPLWYSCLENPHGQRSLADHSPWGRKESDTTEQLSPAQ